MSVTRKDYTDHLELFTEQLVEVFNHQESGVKAQHCDLRLFETFLIENEITHIDTNTILQFIVYVRKERKNSPESTNRKLSSIKTYLRYLRFSSVQCKGLLISKQMISSVFEVRIRDHSRPLTTKI